MRQATYLRDLEQDYIKSRKNNNNDLSKAKLYVEKMIESAPEGSRHNVIFSLCTWWKHIGGTFSDFEKIMPTWADKEYSKQLKHLEKEWYTLK